MATTMDTAVLVIGGGGCGLSSSIFLSNLGVDHVLVERHPGTAIWPKAHYLNQRTMEVYRQHGIADAIHEVGCPVDKFGIRWMTSLGGDGPLDRKIIHRMDAFGTNSLRERYEADSPVMATNYPQIRLEPLLRAEAEKRAPGRLLFHHEVRDWEQTDSGVTVTVVNRDTSEEMTIHARYVIAADGGKTIGPREGVEMVGPTNMADMVSTHFAADLSEYWDDESLLTWFLNPRGESSWAAGVMAQHGPTWGRNSEEWAVHFAFRPDDPERFNEQAMIPRIRELLGLPDLDIKVLKINHWILDRIVADRWRYADIFLAGDAAHRQPPTTGLGLNTAIQDAHNLTWKLAHVLSGAATDDLLDTYELERKPVAIDGADWAMLAFGNHQLIDASVGLMPGAPLEARVAAFEALFADNRVGAALRARVGEAINTQRYEFQAHDVELGYHYQDGALVSDGTSAPPRSATGTDYTPTSRPGHRLPHAWLEKDIERVSTHDLAGDRGAFVLITGPSGDAWAHAARVVGKTAGVTINVARVGVEYNNADGAWAAVGEIGEQGAVLVRPDNHVGWRQFDAAGDLQQTLSTALAAILNSH